jgi:hypothetical protein
MSDITELDETAQRLKVSWRKANNYYASFASQLLEIRRQIESGAYGSEWTFSGWLLKKAGLFESQVMTQLKVFSRVIAAEEREKIEQANIEIAVQKRAEKRAAAAAVAQRKNERAIAKAHEAREREAFRAEKTAEKQVVQQRKATEAEKVERAKKREEKRNALRRAPPANATLRELLAQAATVEQKSRAELGRLYAAMKEEVQTERAGTDEDGHRWTWRRWVAAFIPERSYADIDKCIVEYRASCATAQSENVVHFPKSVA